MLTTASNNGYPAPKPPLAALHTSTCTQAEQEWGLSLARLTNTERSKVLGLAGVVPRAEVEGSVDRGLWRFLEPHLEQTAEGGCYLRDANQRQLLRVGASAASLSFGNCAVLVHGVRTANLRGARGPSGRRLRSRAHVWRQQLVAFCVVSSPTPGMSARTPPGPPVRLGCPFHRGLDSGLCVSKNAWAHS